ncbi:cytidylyltransferase domain-containing protein [Clostridium cellulovorans]|uniref:Acylneuraminate cytidylyltransferase n=1 Tax=Clostridium cellulovorans (strain ATCC 35296 / DSM 3052 / OCM 3 / 743B) TaxID=573061 RepID=D9SN70_CLOC7|nr:acylneuraminate cytidylyltransferase family protein [Clostridium cellulovorans]ADL51936.1 acylneuraminate cytidylyltransferase [Clostridium cellulovorans 743B]
MKILFTVCGRAGSKGLRNKNLKTFLGDPLMYYTLSCIDLFKKRNSNRFHIDIAINSDSQDLLKLAGETNLDILQIRRVEELGKDDTPKVSVIRNSLEMAEKEKGYGYDIIVDLDITSPLRTIIDLENAVNKKIENTSTDVVFSVVEARRNPYFNMVKNENGVVSKVISSNFVARQQAPEVYDMNASIYVYAKAFLINNDVRTVFDGKIDIVKMTDTAILDIDSENDFELMEIMAEYLYKTYPKFKDIKDNIKSIV